MAFHIQTQDLLEELNHPGWNLFNTAKDAVTNKIWPNIRDEQIPYFQNFVPSISNAVGLDNIRNTINNQKGQFVNAGMAYPTDDVYGTGIPSSARHQAASAAASDFVGKNLNYYLPGKISSFLGDTASFASGLGAEVMPSGSLWNFVTGGFDTDYLKAGIADIKDNWTGSFGTEPSTSIDDIIASVYKPQTDMIPIAKKVNMMDTQLNQSQVPTVQPTVQPIVNNVSPGGGNSRRQTTQSAAPVFKSYGPPNMQRF